MRYSDYGDDEDWLGKQLDILLEADARYLAGELTDEEFDVTFDAVYEAIEGKIKDKP